MKQNSITTQSESVTIRKVGVHVFIKHHVKNSCSHCTVEQSNCSKGKAAHPAWPGQQKHHLDIKCINPSECQGHNKCKPELDTWGQHCTCMKEQSSPYNPCQPYHLCA